MARSSFLVLLSKIRELITTSRTYVFHQVNSTVILTHFEIGRLIVENEQSGEDKAEYGKEILKNLSSDFTNEFGRGFSVDNLELMRRFYLVYRGRISESLIRKSFRIAYDINYEHVVEMQLKSESVSRKSPDLALLFKLSWTHFVHLLKMEEQERNFYEIETVMNNWSVRELKRQYNSSLFERVALSLNKEEVKKLSRKGQIYEKPADLLKQPYVLEFLGLKEEPAYSESQLEQAIIDKIELFLLELGKGFLFEARQKRISFEGDDFYIDLIFYNRMLKCYILIDLKIGKLNHSDIGQMQMYVNYFDRVVKLPEENRTVGIILCKQNNKTVVEFTLPEGQDQIYSREYKLYLPDKEELRKQLEMNF